MTTDLEADLLKRNAGLLIENQQIKDAVNKLIEIIKPALDKCEDVAEKAYTFINNDLAKILTKTEGVNS